MSNPGTLFGSGIIRLGGGEIVGARVGAPPAAHHLDIRDGTAALPVGIGVTASYSRVDATTRAEINAMGPEGTDGPDGATVLRAAIKGTPGSQVQISAIVAAAWQTGTFGEPGADATPGIFTARTSGGATGRAIGSYFEASPEVAGGGGQGIEVRVKNQTGEAHAYTAGAPSKTMGHWVNASNNTVGAAFQIGHGFGATFDVGIGANVGSITTAFLRDDSNSKISYDIHGEHTEAAIMLREKSGAIVFNTAAGNFKLEQAAAVNNFMTGTAAGDGVILTGAKTIHIGAGAARAMVRVSENLALGVTAADSFAGGKGIIFIANAQTAPSETPTGGGIFFTEAGALKYKGSAGTVTTIAPA